MGRRGPLPTPVEVRNAQGGTPGKGAVSHRAAKKPIVLGQRVVSGDEISPQLPLPPAGQKMWDDVIPVLLEYNAATLLDAYELSIMCVLWGDVVALYEVVRQERYDFGSTGQMRRSPVVKDFLEVTAAFSKRANEFGMSLDSRTRLALANVTTRSIESDLNARIGVNPRRTNRQVDSQKKKQIEKA